MTGIYHNLQEFIRPIKGLNRSDDFNENVSASRKNDLFPIFEDYDHLKELLRRGQKDIAKSCIEKGFHLKKNSNDKTYDGTPLHLAVSLEYLDIVKLLLENGAPINSLNDCDETPLMLAAIVGNNEIIDMILTKTEPNNHLDRKNFSHFHIACMRNNVSLVQKFLSNGEDINIMVEKTSMFWPGFTPLHFAVEFRSIETAKLLVEKGADITIQDSRGLTPLHLAFRKRNRILTELLLLKQYFYASNPVDSEGLSHFHIACATYKVDIVEDFLNKKVDVTHIIPHENSENWYGYCGFKFAINNSCMDVLKFLLKCKSATVSRYESRILDYAYTSKNEEILNLIISSVERSLVNFQCSSAVASSKEDVNVCTANQKKSTMILRRFNVSQYTELHVAVLQANKDQINSLLEMYDPSIITLSDVRGKTPLHLAFETNQMDLVDQFLELHFKLDENPVDCNNLSHFHISCTRGYPLIVEDFITKGVDINMPINFNSQVLAGCTPLHLAIKYWQEEIVPLLLDNEADFTFKNALNITPYHLTIPYFYDRRFRLIQDDCYRDYWELAAQILIAQQRCPNENFDDQGLTLLLVTSAHCDSELMYECMSADEINKTSSKNLHPWAGFTPLNLAAYYNNKEAIKVLLDCGADVTIESCSNYLPGHYAGYYPDTDDRLYMVPKNIYNDRGMSIFHFACGFKSTKVIEHFLKIGANVHKRIPHTCDDCLNNFEGDTPLHLAVFNNNLEIVELLLKHGVNVNARDCYFNTPLHRCSSKEVLEILLKYGADPDALNCKFHTALEAMAECCSEPDFTTAIIENGWDINKIKIELIKSLLPSNTAVLAKHIKRLKLLGFDLNQEIENLYRTLNEKIGIYITCRDYGKECTKELDLMKEIEIDNRTKLYDVLHKGSREMVKYSKNEILRKIIESEQDFRKTYPNYAYLIILQYKKGIKRRVLLEEGKKSLNLLAGRGIADLVSEMILEFFDDHELTYLTYATSGQNIFQ